jgi:predicted nuclease of predicted toxin-antitoxin system
LPRRFCVSIVTRFLIDEMVNQKVVRAIPARQKGFDIRYLEEAGLKGLADKPIRDVAIAEDRILVTLDRDFAKYQLKPGDIPRGVLWIRPSPRISQKRIGELLAKFCELVLRTFPNKPYDFDQKILEVNEHGVEVHTNAGLEIHSF